MEAGTFEARPVNHQLGQSSNGTPQVKIVFVVGDADERIDWYGYLSDKAFDRTVEALRAMGFTGGDFTDMELTKPVEIVTEFEEYNGKTRLKVKWVNAIGGSKKVAPLDSGSLSALNARLKMTGGYESGDPGIGDEDIPY